MEWRAVYAGGSVRSSQEGDWADLDHGVVVAIWWDDQGIRHLECGSDALVNTGKAIVGVNLPTIGLTEAAIIDASVGLLKYGMLLEPDQWAKVRELADGIREP